MNSAMNSEQNTIAQDVAAVQAIGAVPAMLRIICDATGMGFAAVARVTETSWTACAVQDNIAFGLGPGGTLPVETTLCIEARAAREPVFFDDAGQSARYGDHHTPRIYNIKSYISVPIVMADGEYFGNLCAIDPQPRPVSTAENLAMFKSFAQLIAAQLLDERRAARVASELAAEKTEAQAREVFMAVLGHDLRSPLAALTVGAERLAAQARDEPSALLAQRMLRTMQRMGLLIDDVLDMVRGKFGHGITASTRPVDRLGALIGDVVDEHRLANPARAIHSRIEVTRAVVCDPVRVQQLVSNLIANALTHGEGEQPVVLSADLSGDLLEIAVLNEGDPIPLEQQQQVFEPYWRAAGAADEDTNLGLFIAGQIANAHGGGIQVTSSKEGGTLFLASLKVG